MTFHAADLPPAPPCRYLKTALMLYFQLLLLPRLLQRDSNFVEATALVSVTEQRESSQLVGKEKKAIFVFAAAVIYLADSEVLKHTGTSHQPRPPPPRCKLAAAAEISVVCFGKCVGCQVKYWLNGGKEGAELAAKILRYQKKATDDTVNDIFAIII
jgi:hypothetical protein